MIKYLIAVLKDTRGFVLDGSDLELRLTNEKETELLTVFNFKQYQDIVSNLDRVIEELNNNI